MQVIVLNAVKLSRLLSEYSIINKSTEIKPLFKNGDIKLDGKVVDKDIMIKASDYKSKSVTLELRSLKITIEFA